MRDLAFSNAFNILSKRLRIMVIIVLVSVIMTGILSVFIIKPKYQSYTTFMITSTNASESVSKNSIKTYSEFIKSKVIMGKVIENLKLPITTAELRNKINVSLLNDTVIIEMKVTYTNKSKTASIADEIVEVLRDYLSSSSEKVTIKVIDKAAIPDKAIYPKPFINMALAFILALLISIFLMLLIDQKKHLIKNADDVLENLDLPVLGIMIVPTIIKNDRNS